MIKKNTLALFGLTVCSAVSAGTSEPACLPNQVTVPCAASMWDLGVQALYLKPVFDANRAYGLTDLNSTHARELDNQWDFGFRLEGTYHFSTGSDVSMNWSHLDANNRHAGTYAGQFLFVEPLQPDLFVQANAALSTTDKFDQVNLVMGQHVDVGVIKNARFYGGLQYAKINIGSSSLYSVTDPAQVPITGHTVEAFDNLTFNGVGPVIGVDYAYEVVNGLSLTANTAMAMVYGTSRQNTGFIYATGDVIAPTYSIYRVLVPELEAKLGINYTWQMAEGTLNLQGGYQVLNYFNALHGDARPGIVATNASRTNSDYGLYGPYFGIKWQGMA